MAARDPSGSPAAALRALFRDGGYVRRPHLDRRRREGSNRYKKGSEVRLVVRSREELERTRRHLVAVGLKPGRPFTKGLRIVQPVYGKDAIQWFQGAGLD